MRINIFMPRPRVAVFVNHPECSYQSAYGIINAVKSHYRCELFGVEDISDRHLKKFDLVAFPGGIGDSNSWHRLLADTQDVIHNHIELGKHYLGICMGAYWAGPHYYNILRDIDTRQYIKRQDAEIRRSFATTTEVIWRGQPEQMFFYDGCSLIGSKRNFRTIARYTNGDPAAIIQGRIGVIGPHPESDLDWYNRTYLEPYWHEYSHHDLLLDFVNELMSR